jgi:hypothetical protein
VLLIRPQPIHFRPARDLPWPRLPTDEEVTDVLRAVPKHRAAATYIVFNGPMATTAAPAKVATGTAIKTLLQLKPAVNIRPIAWGISFDGSAAATPGVCELVETDVAATVTAFAAADVQPYGRYDATANTAGTSGAPLNLGTTHSGYTATAEGTITATRMADLQLIAPTNQYLQQFPLGREFDVAVGKFLRVRVTFGTTVNALTWVIFEA